MIELKVGGDSVAVRATPLSLLFYRQEFDRDMLADLVEVFMSVVSASSVDDDGDVQVDLTGDQYLTVMRLVWAMAKSEQFGFARFPSFESWLVAFEDIPLFDSEFIMAALGVAAEGLFCDERNARGATSRRGSARDPGTARPPVADDRQARRPRLRGDERASLPRPRGLRGRAHSERGEGARGDAGGHRLVPVLGAGR